MQRRVRNEVDISEIFDFAEDKFKKGWNTCCAIFQGADEILPFIGVRDFGLVDLENELKIMSKLAVKDDRAEGYAILVAYMKKHKIKEMRYTGTGN